MKGVSFRLPGPVITWLPALALAGLAIGLSAWLIPEPNLEDPRRLIHFGEQLDEPGLLARGYEKIHLADPASPEASFQWVSALCVQDTGRDWPDAHLDSLIYHGERAVRDAALLAKGRLQECRHEPQKAWKTWQMIENQDLPWLNYARGEHAREAGNWVMARFYYEREVLLPNGNRQAAYRALIKMALDSRDLEEIQRLMNDPGIRSQASPGLLRRYFLLEGEAGNYLLAVLSTPFAGSNWQIWLTALLAGALWLWFLINLNKFQPHPWRLISIAFLAGFFLPLVATWFYDLAIWRKGWEPGTPEFYLLVGTLEEGLKLLALVLILLPVKRPSGPYQYFLLAGMVALGFASCENLVYFSYQGLQIAPARAIASVTGHLFCSGIAVLGFPAARPSHNPKWSVFLVPGFWLVAALLHGGLDYTLDRGLPVPYLALFLGGVILWMRAINNALNFDPKFNLRQIPKPGRQRSRLALAVTLLLVLLYLLDAGIYGPSRARLLIWENGLPAFLLAIVLVSQLSKLYWRKRVWLPLLRLNDKSIPPMRIPGGFRVRLIKTPVGTPRHDRQLPVRHQISLRSSATGAEDREWYALPLLRKGHFLLFRALYPAQMQLYQPLEVHFLELNQQALDLEEAIEREQTRYLGRGTLTIEPDLSVPSRPSAGGTSA